MEINRNTPHCLHRVYMQRRASYLCATRRFLNRLHRTRFVISPHQRGYCRGRIQGGKISNVTVAAHAKPVHLRTRTLKSVHTLQYRGVLDRAGHHTV